MRVREESDRLVCEVCGWSRPLAEDEGLDAARADARLHWDALHWPEPATS